MKPIKLVAENFKALDFEHELKPVTMFTGPNESGKTARLDAVKVALLGYHSEGKGAVGKQPSATFSFAGENRTEMRVHLEFDDGKSITRTFKRKTDGDVSRSVTGEIPAVPYVLFDGTDYLHATGQERIKAVFDRIDISKIVVSDEELLEKLGKIEAVPAAECVKAREEMIGVVGVTIKRRGSLKQSPQVWLEGLVKELTDGAKGQKTLQDNAAAQLQSIKPSGKPPVSVAKEIEAAQKKLETAKGEKAKLDIQRTNFTSTEQRRKELETILQKPAVDIAALEKEKAEVDAKIAAHSSSTDEIRAQNENLLKEYRRIEEKIKSENTLITELAKSKTDLEGEPKCPFCKSSKQGWKNDYKKELDERIAEAKERLFQNAGQLDLVRSEGIKTKADLAAAEKADAQINELRTKSIDLNNQLVLARKDANARAGAEGELKGLQRFTEPIEAEYKKIEAEIHSLTVSRAVLGAQEAAFTNYTNNSAQFKALEQKLLAHQVRVEVFKQAAKIVTDEQKAIVANAFETILAPARRFTDGIIDGKLDYQNDELGYHSAAGWVGHKVMSGRGKDLAYLGLQVALAQQSPIKVILMDEMADFDVPTKAAVIQRFLALTREGFIDAAICADPRAEDYKPESIIDVTSPDITVIELTK